MIANIRGLIDFESIFIDHLSLLKIVSPYQIKQEFQIRVTLKKFVQIRSEKETPHNLATQTDPLLNVMMKMKKIYKKEKKDGQAKTMSK